MNRHYKYFILLTFIIITIFSFKLYLANKTDEKIKISSIEYEAKSIADFMMAFRQTYQNIFIQNHLKLDESNIAFLPVKTTNEIADVFSKLNTKSKISTVSDRPRNPINMANERQMLVIKDFQDNIDKKSSFETLNNKYYYSQPLYINNVCLKCHGKKEDAPKIIRDNYDSAYNYKLGELRGILDIELSQTELGTLIEENSSKRIISISLILTILLLAIFIYVKQNIKLEKLLKNKELTLDKTLSIFGENVIASNSDLKGIITYASPALCEISGYSQDELMGKPHSILRHQDTKSKVYKEMWSNLKQGKPWNGEIKNGTKNGGFYWVTATIVPNTNEKGIVIGYQSVRHNITSEKAKEEFMSNMSHELRTPLNAVIGFSSILEKKQTEPKDKELSSTIHKSALSLLKLINDILDLAKIEDSNFTVDPYGFNAYKEFSEFSEQFEGLTHKKILNYTIDLNDDLKGVFYGDWNRISQIILNLISNAIKFTPQNGLIKVSADYKDNCLIISVSDNGIGMNKEVQDKIFEPFAQADGTTTRKYGGTGLGLSITQNLVGLMHGQIELESQEGKGTTFTVSIPLVKLEDDTLQDIQEQLSEEEKEDSLSGHILIVEDNKTNQMLVKMLVEDFGLTCDVANDGLEAIEIYEPQKHQLVLMDENMPNLNGLEAMKIIKEKYKEETTPIIALTANTMKGDKERFLSLGMDGYLAKPIDEDKLYKTLIEFL